MGREDLEETSSEAYYIKGVSLVFTGYNKEGCISLKKSKELNHIQANYWFNKWCN